VLMLGLVLLLAQSQDERAAAKAADRAVQETVDAFDKEFMGASDAKKVAAIEDLGKVQHPKTASRLGGVIGANESSTVRIAAVQTLGKFSENKKPAGTVMSNVLPASVKEPGFFNHVCAAIGDLKEPVSAAARQVLR
jgi:hypothetical protein